MQLDVKYLEIERIGRYLYIKIKPRAAVGRP
jgi:hypothetical protein